ncbi:MAG: hypothetical protein ABSD97_16005 [Acidimicrobiales bacterium]
MNLDELLDTVATSGPEDWELIECPNQADGPSYLYDPRSGEAHVYRAVFKADVSLGLAWGLSYGPDGEPEVLGFLKSFPDKSGGGAELLDFLWNGSLVHREVGVKVDGGRATLPWPVAITHDDGPGQTRLEGWKVTAREAAYWRLVHSFRYSAADFDSKLAISHLRVE